MFIMLTFTRVARMVMAKLSTPPVLNCHHASCDARIGMNFATWGRSDSEHHCFSEDDLDADEVESQIQSILKEAKKKEKATKFHKIRRKLNSPGAPERRLSWDAIQQIRYLKQESPQEWTLQKLSEGFSVSTDVISRVLRSKFTPPPDRRLKQDAKVLAAVRQQSITGGVTEQSRLPVAGGSVPGRITSGNLSKVPALISEALVPTVFQTGLGPSGDIVPSVTKMAQMSAVTHNTLQEQFEGNEQIIDVNERHELEMQEDEEWDGVVLTDAELNELVHTLPDKPSPVEQKGRDFYDNEGNFLYRI